MSTSFSLVILTASPVEESSLYNCADFTTSDLYFALHSRLHSDQQGKVIWTSVVETADLAIYKEELCSEARSVLKQTQLKHDFDLADVKLTWCILPYQVPASVVVTFRRDPARTKGNPQTSDTLTLGGLPFHRISNSSDTLHQYSSYMTDVSKLNLVTVTAEATQQGLGDVTVGLSTDDMDIDDMSDTPPPSVKVGHREEKRTKRAERTRTCPPRACKRRRL